MKRAFGISCANVPSRLDNILIVMKPLRLIVVVLAPVSLIFIEQSICFCAVCSTNHSAASCDLQFLIKCLTKSITPSASHVTGVTDSLECYPELCICQNIMTTEKPDNLRPESTAAGLEQKPHLQLFLPQ